MMNKNVKELKEMAKVAGIVGYSKMRKEELVSALGCTVETKVEDNVTIEKPVIDVVDDIPLPLNHKDIIENKEEKGDVVDMNTNKEIVIEDNKFDLEIGSFIQNVKSGVCFQFVGLTNNGLYELKTAFGKATWLNEAWISNTNHYVVVDKVVALKSMAAQVEKVSEGKKVTGPINLTKEDIVKSIKEKAEKAEVFAKTKFKFRVEQCNNFRQMVVIDNTTGKQYQVGVGKSIAGRVLELEYQASNGVRVTRTNNTAADNKAKYNANVKKTKCVCVECQKIAIEKGVALTPKDYITEAEMKYLKDNMKYIPTEYKGNGLCYKHQATTKVRKAIIDGRRNDASSANSLLR